MQMLSEEGTSKRTFMGYVSIHSEDPNPIMIDGLYEDIPTFVKFECDSNGDALFFEPKPCNEWLREGYAAATIYQASSGGGACTLATYVEGDVTRYRFKRIEHAIQAARLWSVGL